MKKFLCLLTAICLSCCVFASCFDGSDGGNSVKESVESSFSAESGSESDIQSENGSESDGREDGTYYISLDYNGYADKNAVKTIVAKKGEEISGLPETVITGRSDVVFSKWTYNGKKIGNGDVYNYDFDITIVAEYEIWTKNY